VEGARALDGSPSESGAAPGGAVGADVTAWLQAERARHAAIRLAAEVAPLGVELLVVKGIYLAFAVARSPSFRPVVDADLVVVRGSFARAVAHVRRTVGWTVDESNWSTHAIVDRATFAVIDLHRRPLPPHFGRMRKAALRRRSRPLEDRFGPHLRVPDPLDAAALAVAHFTKDNLGVIGHGKLAADLRLLEERAGVTPYNLARRLEEHGLRRIAVAAFVVLAEADPRWRIWRDVASRSSVETWAMERVVGAVQRADRWDERLGAMAVRGIADRSRDAALGFALAGLRQARDVVVRLRGAGVLGGVPRLR